MHNSKCQSEAKLSRAEDTRVEPWTNAIGQVTSQIVDAGIAHDG